MKASAVSLALICTFGFITMSAEAFQPIHIKQPPLHMRDEGACPFEGCRYGGTIKALVPVKLYAQPALPGTKVKVEIHRVEIGEEVTPIKGFVLIEDQTRFRVTKPHGRYKPGDELYVYTPVGEGRFKVWFNGTLDVEYLQFNPDDVPQQKVCLALNNCWGALEKQFQYSWWIQVKTTTGLLGWTDEGRNHFTGWGIP